MHVIKVQHNRVADFPQSKADYPHFGSAGAQIRQKTFPASEISLVHPVRPVCGGRINTRPTGKEGAREPTPDVIFARNHVRFYGFILQMAV